MILFFYFKAEDGIRDVAVTGVQTCFFFFQAEDGIRDVAVTGVQTCALLIQAEDGIRDVAVTGVQTCALPIFCIGICALYSPIQVPAFFQTGVLILLGAAVVHFVFLAALGRLPRFMGFVLAGAYGEIGRASCRERV